MLTAPVTVKPLELGDYVREPGPVWLKAFPARLTAARAFCMVERGTGEASQAAIARRAGLPEPNVSRYFRGRVPETLETIEALAGAMGVDPGWLAFGPRSAAPMAAIPAVEDAPDLETARKVAEKARQQADGGDNQDRGTG